MHLKEAAGIRAELIKRVGLVGDAKYGLLVFEEDGHLAHLRLHRTGLGRQLPLPLPLGVQHLDLLIEGVVEQRAQRILLVGEFIPLGLLGAPSPANLLHLLDGRLDPRIHQINLLLPPRQLARLVLEGRLADGDVVLAELELVLEQLQLLQVGVGRHAAARQAGLSGAEKESPLAHATSSRWKFGGGRKPKWRYKSSKQLKCLTHHAPRPKPEYMHTHDPFSLTYPL